jgi:hypothetical protein
MPKKMLIKEYYLFSRIGETEEKIGKKRRCGG